MKKTIAIIIIATLEIAYARSRGGGRSASVTPTFGISGSMSGETYDNWSTGGNDYINWKAATNLGVAGQAATSVGTLIWSVGGESGFGKTKFGDLPYRKSTDYLRANSLVYLQTSYLNPYASVNFETQLTKGYIYDTYGSNIQISDFMDPAYLTEGGGIMFFGKFNNTNSISYTLGLAFRQVFTKNFTVFADDPKTTQIENFRNDFGAQTSLKYGNPYANISSTFSVFAPVKNMAPSTAKDYYEATLENELKAKFWTYFTFSASLDLRYEPNFSRKTQFHESFGLGVGYQYGKTF
jgi:hypothetical protein